MKTYLDMRVRPWQKPAAQWDGDLTIVAKFADFDVKKTSCHHLMGEDLELNHAFINPQITVVNAYRAADKPLVAQMHGLPEKKREPTIGRVVAVFGRSPHMMMRASFPVSNHAAVMIEFNDDKGFVPTLTIDGVKHKFKVLHGTRGECLYDVEVTG